MYSAPASLRWFDSAKDSRFLFSPQTPNRPRAFLALCAAAAAVLICLYRRHFTLLLSDPSSFATMTHHRCGWTLMLTTAWCLLETSHLAAQSILTTT